VLIAGGIVVVSRVTSSSSTGKAGGYRLNCHGVSGATIRKNGKSASSFSTAVNVYGPSDY
jgi:hypothetical protein